MGAASEAMSGKPYYEVAVHLTAEWRKQPPTDDHKRNEDIAAIILREVQREHKRLRAILGFDVVTEEEHDGHKINLCHDPYYDLNAAVYDLEQQKADEACIRTIKRHQAKLIAFEKATKRQERG